MTAKKHIQQDYGSVTTGTTSGRRSSSCSSSDGSQDKVVRFDEVHVRQYERIVGDNPSCSSGAPISIGWAHSKTRVMGVDEYEKKSLKRDQKQLVLTKSERQKLLMAWGASGMEVIDSIRANVRAKNQRRQTVNNIGTYDKVEEKLEKVSRKLKYILHIQTPLSSRVKRLQVQSERWSRNDKSSPKFRGSRSGLHSKSGPSQSSSSSSSLSPEMRIDKEKMQFPIDTYHVVDTGLSGALKQRASVGSIGIEDTSLKAYSEDTEDFTSSYPHHSYSAEMMSYYNTNSILQTSPRAA